jgi:hypothetical protein
MKSVTCLSNYRTLFSGRQREGFDQYRQKRVWSKIKTVGKTGVIPYGQKINTAAKMEVVQASTMKQLNAPFRTAPHGSA